MSQSYGFCIPKVSSSVGTVHLVETDFNPLKIGQIESQRRPDKMGQSYGFCIPKVSSSIGTVHFVATERVAAAI